MWIKLELNIYSRREFKMQDIFGDSCDILKGVMLVNIVNLSLDELELEGSIFNDYKEVGIGDVEENEVWTINH